MWRKIGSGALMLFLVVTTAKEISAQEVQWVPRSQLFSAVLGEQIGKTLSAAMDAYLLGKAAKEQRDEIRAQLSKCGNNCPDELKNKMAKYEKEQASVESLIDDVALKNNMGFNGLDPLKRFLSLDPPKLTAEQKDWIDMNSRLNIIASYCYTMSDQLPEKQKDCESNTPYKIAKDMDDLL